MSDFVGGNIAGGIGRRKRHETLLPSLWTPLALVPVQPVQTLLGDDKAADERSGTVAKKEQCTSMKPTFGQRMNVRRKAMNYTWPKLAKLSGIKSQTLKDIALGRHQPGIRTMIAVAGVLNSRCQRGESVEGQYEQEQWDLLWIALTEFFTVKERLPT